MDSTRPMLSPKHVVTIIINSLSVILCVYMGLHVVFYRPSSGQSIRWSLQRKLRFVAVFFCFLTKGAELTYYIAYMMARDGFCTSASCINDATQLGNVLKKYVAGVTNILCLLFIWLTTFNRFASLSMIAPNTRAYTYALMVVGFFIVFTLVAMITNIIRETREALTLSVTTSNLLFIVIVLWILSMILSELIISRKVIALTLKPLPKHTPVPLRKLNKETDQEPSTRKRNRASHYRSQTGRRLYLYYSAIVSMDILMVLMFTIGSFFEEFAMEANVIATSWIPLHIYFGFKLLNITYEALKRCQQPNFTSLNQSSGFTDSECKTGLDIPAGAGQTMNISEIIHTRPTTN